MKMGKFYYDTSFVVSLFLLVLLSFHQVSSTTCIEKEREALLKFKQSLVDPSNRLVSWKGADCCSWYGIGCHQTTGYVTEIDFFRIGSPSSITLPRNWADSSLLELKYLSRLSLSEDFFNYTQLPDWFGQLKNLKHLNLRGTSLSGQIPASLGNLTNIEFLGFSKNMLSGEIPDSLGKLFYLKQLNLGENNLNGLVPDSFGHLQNLEVLDISDNALQGSISEIHFTNLSRLHTLWLWDNSPLSLDMKPNWVPPFQLKLFSAKSCKVINSEIPKWLQTQNELVFLDLSNTSIQGSIPTWLGPNLMALDLSYNQINGSLPDRVNEQMPNLGSLYLTKNHISGSLPQSLCKFSRLVALDLSANRLSGIIPSCLLTPKLMLLDLSSNMFSRAFPTSFRTISPLDQLHLNHNNIEGELPIVLKNCTFLTLLDLEGNRFSGNIPAWLGKSLRNLQILNLRDNMFNGTIPSTLFFLPYLKNLVLARNQLVGNIPPNLSNLSAMSIGGKYQFKGMAMYCFMFSPYCNYQRNVIQYFKSREFNYSNIMQLPLIVNIDLSCNNLVGLIPSEITTLKALIGLNLSHNNLSGGIPENIGRMTSLQSLDFSFNQLSGPLPVSMSNLNSLGVLKLSHNNFSGRIPREGHLLTFNDASSYNDNPFLCGDPLLMKCPSEKSSGPPSGIDNFEDQSGQEWDRWEKMLLYFIIIIGYAAGFWGVVGVLIFKRKWRSAYFRFTDKTKNKAHVAIMVGLARCNRRIGGKNLEQ